MKSLLQCRSNDDILVAIREPTFPAVTARWVIDTLGIERPPRIDGLRRCVRTEEWSGESRVRRVKPGKFLQKYGWVSLSGVFLLEYHCPVFVRDDDRITAIVPDGTSGLPVQLGD